MTQSPRAESAPLSLRSRLARRLEDAGRLFEPAGLVLVAGLYLFNPLRFTLPLGYAGLYSLMTEAVGQAGLRPPSSVPYYGPGGVPFAYPPFGFYVGSLIQRLLGLDPLTYARFAPAVFSLAALVLFYGFVRRLTENRDTAFVAALLAGMGANVYFAHASAAGTVRALALALALGAMLVGVRVVRELDAIRWAPPLCGLLLGLAGLTHLAYGLFAGLGLVALGLFERTVPERTALRRSAVVGAVAVGVALPWVLMVAGRYGWDAFLAAGGTHSTFPFWQRASGRVGALPLVSLEWLMNLGSAWRPWLLAGLALFGLGYAVWKRRWFFPAWLVLTAAIIGEALRFEEMLGAALAAVALIGVVPLRQSRGASHLRLISLGRGLMYALILGAFVYQGARNVYNDRPALTPELYEATVWMRDNSQEGSWFLSLPNHHSQTEWLPYLTQRNLAIGHWGAEWTGGYARQQSLQSRLAACSERQSLDCVEALSSELPAEPDYLISENELDRLIEQLLEDEGWVRVFQNEGFSVFEAAPADTG